MKRYAVVFEESAQADVRESYDSGPNPYQLYFQHALRHVLYDYPTPENCLERNFLIRS